MDDITPTGPDPLDILREASARPVVTAPEDIPEAEMPYATWGGEPYAKTDRVPEVALPLEAEVCRVLADRDGEERTPAMLRMLRGRMFAPGEFPGPALERPVFFALFEVLDREGGTVVGHLAALDVGQDHYVVGPVGPLADAVATFESNATAEDLARRARER